MHHLNRFGFVNFLLHFQSASRLRRKHGIYPRFLDNLKFWSYIFLNNNFVLIFQLEHPWHSYLLRELHLKRGRLGALTNQLTKFIKPIDHISIFILTIIFLLSLSVSLSLRFTSVIIRLPQQWALQVRDVQSADCWAPWGVSTLHINFVLTSGRYQAPLGCWIIVRLNVVRVFKVTLDWAHRALCSISIFVLTSSRMAHWT